MKNITFEPDLDKNFWAYAKEGTISEEEYKVRNTLQYFSRVVIEGRPQPSVEAIMALYNASQDVRNGFAQKIDKIAQLDNVYVIDRSTGKQHIKKTAFDNQFPHLVRLMRQYNRILCSVHETKRPNQNQMETSQISANFELSDQREDFER